MSAKPGEWIRTFISIAASLEAGMPLEDVARMRKQMVRTQARQRRDVQREISILTQTEILEREILQCFIADMKRGDRGKSGGGNGASRANEAKKLKVVRWDMKHRRY